MGYNLDLLKMMEFIFSMGNPLPGESIGVVFVFVCVCVMHGSWSKSMTSYKLNDMTMVNQPKFFKPEL